MRELTILAVPTRVDPRELRLLREERERRLLGEDTGDIVAVEESGIDCTNRPLYLGRFSDGDVISTAGCGGCNYLFVEEASRVYYCDLRERSILPKGVTEEMLPQWVNL